MIAQAFSRHKPANNSRIGSGASICAATKWQSVGLKSKVGSRWGNTHEQGSYCPHRLISRITDYRVLQTWKARTRTATAARQEQAPCRTSGAGKTANGVPRALALAQALRWRRRHQARKPAQAAITPGS